MRKSRRPHFGATSSCENARAPYVKSVQMSRLQRARCGGSGIERSGPVACSTARHADAIRSVPRRERLTLPAEADLAFGDQSIDGGVDGRHQRAPVWRRPGCGKLSGDLAWADCRAGCARREKHVCQLRCFYAGRRHRRLSMAAPIAAPRHGIRLQGRFPIRWRDGARLAGSDSHGARPLPSQSRRVGLRDLGLRGAAAQQVYLVAETPRFLEIESSRGCFHSDAQGFDRVGHNG